MKLTMASTALISAASALVPRLVSQSGNTSVSALSSSEEGKHEALSGNYYAGMNQWGGDDVEFFAAVVTVPELKAPKKYAADGKFEMAAYLAMDNALINMEQRQCQAVLFAGFQMQLEYQEPHYRAFYGLTSDPGDTKYFDNFEIRPEDKIRIIVSRQRDERAMVHLNNERTGAVAGQEWTVMPPLCSDRVGCYVTSSKDPVPEFSDLSFDNVEVTMPTGRRAGDLVEPLHQWYSGPNVDCSIERDTKKVSCKYKS